MVFGDVIGRYPRIKFLLVHGGGFLPSGVSSTVGRSEQSRARDCRHRRKPPSINFFSIPARPVGARISGVMGSDYPFDMGTLECTRQVEALLIAEPEREQILGGAAMKLLALA